MLRPEEIQEMTYNYREVKKELGSNYRSLKDFYLDPDRRARLEKMSRFRRWIWSSWWLLQGMVSKLTPFRKVLLIVALVIAGGQMQNSGNQSLLPLLILLFILMLELRDKLMATDELKAGRDVQKALSPDQQPQVDGWQIWVYNRSAREVGGDLVDFFRLPDDSALLTLADVAGKGLPAALLAVQLQAVIHTSAGLHPDPAGRITLLNRHLRGDGLPQRFVSMIHLQISPGSNEIVYTNAGHLPPLIRQETEITVEQKGEPALGLLDDPQYTIRKRQLDPGDVFLVYSDGVTELCDPGQKFFGEENLVQLVRQGGGKTAAELGTSILNSLDIFRDNMPQTDDISLLILRRNPQ
jgi:sigma-B regulation protein RsbU (phosphoserine phosphatase)